MDGFLGGGTTGLSRDVEGPGSGSGRGCISGGSGSFLRKILGPGLASGLVIVAGFNSRSLRICSCGKCAGSGGLIV